MTTRIYTKTGDAGQTTLFGGQRVSKDALRVEVYGTVDELNATLGMARAAAPLSPAATPPAEGTVPLDATLHDLQSLLFDLGAVLATPPDAKRQPPPLPADAVTRLEGLIDTFEAELLPLKSFILPGGTPQSAALHLARAVCRRAERLCVHLRSTEPQTQPETLVLLNRLSDLLFVMARLANHRAGVGDVPWISSAAT